MKGNDQVIAKLNAILKDELTATNQYMVHAELCENWGYQYLHDVIKKRAIDEMKHAEKLIERITFLEGKPEVGFLNEVHIGTEIEQQHNYDLRLEIAAAGAYNEGIKLAAEAGDNGTRELLTANLTDEERHIDWLEAQLDQISQMGAPRYLAQQVVHHQTSAS